MLADKDKHACLLIGNDSQSNASLPIAWRLYLPERWAHDAQRRKKTGIPEEVRLQTKPAIALEQIQHAIEEGVSPAPVLADAAYGKGSKFREGIGERGLSYYGGSAIPDDSLETR